MAKAVYPARDTPLALVVLVTVGGACATVAVFSAALADRSYAGMAFAVLVLGVNALLYASRLRVILRHRR